MKKWSVLASIPSAIAVIATSFAVYAEELNIKSANLQILWSVPIMVDSGPPPVVGKPAIEPKTKGLQLGNSVMFLDGRIAFLGEFFDPTLPRGGLLMNAEHSPEDITPLQLRGAKPEPRESILVNKPSDRPGIASITAGGHDTIWVGGSTHYYMDIGSASHSDAYLAKLDNTAKPLWEQAYKTGPQSLITGMAPTSSGDMVVVAKDMEGGQSWLALIAASDGHPIWERHLDNGDNGNDLAIVPVKGDRFIVAKFDSQGSRANYQETVSVRTVTADGQIGNTTGIRQGINKERAASNLGNVRMSATEDGAYVVSNWDIPFLQNLSLLQPVEIAKISAEGKLLWSKILPDSFRANTDRGGATFCSDPAVATLPNGDGLVACALDRNIHLYTLDRNTGNYKQGSVPLPACNDGQHPVSLFLFVRKDGTILLSGSRPSNNVGPGCSWMGRLTIKATLI